MRKRFRDLLDRQRFQDELFTGPVTTLIEELQEENKTYYDQFNCVLTSYQSKSRGFHNDMIT